MDELVYPKEKTLGRIALILGVLGWIALIVLTLGVALIYILLGFIGYLFAQSGLIAWLRGTGVRLSQEQLPELYAQYLASCKKLGIEEPPEAYLLQGEGMINAFATRFLGRNFVILLSDTVDALSDMPDGINFYIGHELGHIKRGHLTGHIWRMPALWLPLLGAAYSRAQEYTCDLHGRACCESAGSAARAMAVLAVGAEKWKTINLVSYARQIGQNRGFFPDFHELIGAYPWLNKRMARIMNPDIKMPGRNPFSYFFAMFVPHAGRLGGGASFAMLIMIIAMVGALAAVALPKYQEYVARAEVLSKWTAAAPARASLGEYYISQEEVPDDLQTAGVKPSQAEGLRYDSDNMSLHATTKFGTLSMIPSEDDGKVIWHCSSSNRKVLKALPESCRESFEGDED